MTFYLEKWWGEPHFSEERKSVYYEVRFLYIQFYLEEVLTRYLPLLYFVEASHLGTKAIQCLVQLCVAKSAYEGGCALGLGLSCSTATGYGPILSY